MSPAKVPATKSLGDAADAAGCSTWTLRRLVADGRVGAYRLGRKLRFTDQDIRDAVAARATRLERTK